MDFEYQPSVDQEHLESVTATLGHRFQRPSLLMTALTHSSFTHEKTGTGKQVRRSEDNERLEFLGDAVIGLVVAERLMECFPHDDEGSLSRWRSRLVSRATLADLALEEGMDKWVLLGRGEKQSGGAQKRSILAGVFEAVVGALYLDAGIHVTKTYLLEVFEPLIESVLSEKETFFKSFDQKTSLQERVQRLYKTTPAYRLVGATGLEHEKVFQVEIAIAGNAVALGEGRSKKEAEQNAAQKAMEILDAKE